ncbi:hypothetical protein A5685_15780 [Mycobacterium colombiense]|uniref:DUF1214 domain-containing protein n=1 Tax=Mycobacterium colombiense TaxID=339268 RepID=A0A1A2RIJ8_9MYCO|nr:DUF1214 domain-containing protein [Mycobacterium colombiense]OBH51776.1 hypothetical protein A5685_15780 [Mycobacterium colombiense]
MNTTTNLPTWDDQIEALKGVADHLLATWRPDNPTEAEVQDMNKLALSILACGYFCNVYTDTRRPVFMPLWNFACNQGGPNPDYVYLEAQIDGSGVYELVGRRGTVRFVEITQQAAGMMKSLKNVEGRMKFDAITRDLDELTIGEDGSFRVVLSAERPAGYGGDWWELNPAVGKLLMRKCACDWNTEIDAQVAINRLDDAGADMEPAEIARRFSQMGDWIKGMIDFDMELVRFYREHHGINVLLRSQWIQQGGGLATKQAYYDGVYEINDDEALIVEFPVPQDCYYWQILVADDRFSTVDWVNRQSSLNDVQARIDPDGWFRGVVSKQDPGVHNWLDKADWPWGILQARFYRASDFPEATVTKVPVSEVLAHLPSGTAVLTADQRAAQLRHRRTGAQLRRIW